MSRYHTYKEFLTEGLRRSPIQNDLLKKYEKEIMKLNLIEDDHGGLEVNLIRINSSSQGKGTASKIMQEIVDYADKNNKIVHLSPTEEYGMDMKRLTNFYKQFGFIKNSGKNRDKRFDNTMLRPVK